MLGVTKALSMVQRAVLLMSAAALFALPLITAYDVAMRYLLHAPTIWATEISMYLLQFIVFMTPGALLVDGDHLRVSFWIESRTGLARRVAEMVTALLVLPYAGILLWFGWKYAERAFDREMLSPTLLQVPLWIVYAMVPIGAILLILGIILKCMTLMGAGTVREGEPA